SLDAVSNALKAFTGADYKLRVYTEHSMQGQSSGSTAAAYIGLEDAEGQMFWGAGTDTDIIRASAHALLSAYDNMVRK
ncbi:MAG TPA: 2-isopropylmalate synthase, partial [Lachnospiraceae bacterium]|nr:2-isopropylmalate synthase [Lachnospiraceae bacterium]